MEKMGRMFLLLFCILRLFESGFVFAETSNACFGTGENVDMFWLNLQCPSSNMIAITGMYYGVKERNTSCEPPVNNASQTHCCQYDQPNDCLVDVFSTKTSEKVMEIFSNCTGYESCYEQATWHLSTGCDSGIYYAYSSYMMAQYQCVPDSKILQPDSDIETSVTEINIQNVDYPNGTSDNSQMGCSIEVPCDSSLELTAVDIQLGSSTGTFDSTHNNMYERKLINLTDSVRFLVIDIDFAENSKFWIHIKANDSSNLDIACGTKKNTVPLDDCLPTTTAEPTTTEEPSTTEQPATSEHPNITEETTASEVPTSTEGPTTEQATPPDIPTTTEVINQETTTTFNNSSITTSNLPVVGTNDDDQDDTVLIAGVVGGVVAVLVISGIIITVYMCKKKKKNQVSPSSESYKNATENQNQMIEPTTKSNTVPTRLLKTGDVPPPKQSLWTADLPQTVQPQKAPRSSELAPLKESVHKPNISKRTNKGLTDIESPDTDNVDDV